jgi:hypothetical protein
VNYERLELIALTGACLLIVVVTVFVLIYSAS